MSNLPPKAEKSYLNSHFDRNFLKSTLILAAILIIGFVASLGFSRQADIAKAFIPPQPLKNVAQIQSTTCFNQNSSAETISRGDLISCEIKLVPESPELNISDYSYNTVLSTGKENNSTELVGSSSCSYNDTNQTISCVNLVTEKVPMGETRKINLSVTDLSKKEVVLFDTGIEVVIN